MKLQELISKKNYDYISIRKDVSGVTGIPEDDIFAGVCYSEGGKIFSHDGDSYSGDLEVLRYEEWASKIEQVKSGLTIVIP